MAELLVSRHQGITTIRLNRPAALNAFDAAMASALADAVADAAADDDCRVMVLTGEGRAFCAGADLKHLRALMDARDWGTARRIVEEGSRAVAAIASAPKAVIAAVNGVAVGGGANLALACDIRIASERASIGQVFNRVGLVPDMGGTYFLPRLVGFGKAMELVLTADIIDAAEGHRIGLFNHVVAHEKLAEATTALAERLAAKPTHVQARAKAMLARASSVTLEAALAMEIDEQVALFSTDDVRERLAAWDNKSESGRGSAW